jgi:hypothetical protein
MTVCARAHRPSRDRRARTRNHDRQHVAAEIGSAEQRVVDHHPQAVGPHETGEPLFDPAKADDPERDAAQTTQRAELAVARPFAGPDSTIARDDPALAREDESECVFRDLIGWEVRHVRDRGPASASMLDVHAVDPGAAPRNHLAARGRR